MRERALIEAKKRFARSGLNNVQFHLGESSLGKYHKKMDWVVLDVPCTGTGTIRRNPDLKWKFSKDVLNEVTQSQRQIFEEGLKYLKPDGKVLYSTCSLLSEENEKQVEYFIKKFGLKLHEGKYFQALPATGSHDGFFSAILYKP